MHTRQILQSYCSRHLGEIVSGFKFAHELEPLKADIYIGISLLQKSIRRGQHKYAIPAALCVLQHSQSAFWRRLCIISFEDIGIANVNLVEAVLFAAGRQKFRHDLGGDEAVAIAVVSAMCISHKDRSLDDLFEFAQMAKGLDPLKRNLAAMTLPEILESSANFKQPLIAQALAVLSYSIGLPISRNMKQGRLKRTDAFLDALIRLRLDPLLVELSRYGLARTRSILPVLHPVLFNRQANTENTAQTDIFMPSIQINELPCWVYNANTRIGLLAIRNYIKQSRQMSEFLKAFSTRELSKQKVVGNLTFQMESTQLKNRLVWDIGMKTRQSVDALGPGIQAGKLEFAKQILTEEFGLLNQCRTDAAQLYIR